MNHRPIDYSTWNFDGTGNNILMSFLPLEKEIWNTALPYQDKRDDIGHAENVTYFALKLVDYLHTSRDVIIPAAILHDIGWSQLSDINTDFYASLGTDSELELRLRHQQEGVKLATKLLQKIVYPQQYVPQILEIISQHDTRNGFYSSEDGIVRDADKLWRFTLPHWYILLNKTKMNPQEASEKHFSYLIKEGFFYSDTAKEIAKIELENTVVFYKNGFSI